jgi:transporter family protein
MNWLAWSLLSAVFAAAPAVLAKVGVADVNSHVATAVRTTVVLVFAWGVALAIAPLRSVLDFPARTWTFLALSGVATGLSWICYFRALQLGEASKVAPIDKLSVVFVALFAVLFLGERLALPNWLGVILIACGAVLVAYRA